MSKLRILLLTLSSIFVFSSAAYATDEAAAPKQPEAAQVETDAEKAKKQADAPKEGTKDQQTETKKN
jgi:hypothetical protein